MPKRFQKGSVKKIRRQVGLMWVGQWWEDGIDGIAYSVWSQKCPRLRLKAISPKSYDPSMQRRHRSQNCRHLGISFEMWSSRFVGESGNNPRGAQRKIAFGSI